MADPIAAKYLRPYVGAHELLHNGDRYCLWLVDATASDLRRSSVLRDRVAGVRNFRLASAAASTRDAASTAQLFRQIAQPATSYLCIPAHVSENRPYFLAARFPPEVITSNANFLTPDPDGLVFALISSRMFITWQKSVGGRIKSDIRFNKLLTWNTFPVPDLSAEAAERIKAAGKAVLVARERQVGTPLADMYPSTGIGADLQQAHDALDRDVDRSFGAQRANIGELERQDILFEHYLRLTTGLLHKPASPRRRRSHL